jgi:hypothetical protein
MKSPEVRALEWENFNREAKAQRFVDALKTAGITKGQVASMEQGYMSPTQIQAGATPRWGNLAEFLGEEAPSDLTVGQIMKMMGRKK